MFLQAMMLRLHISCIIGYLHDYVPTLKTRKFVQELRYDNRQYPLDWLSGMSTGTNSFIKHQHTIRDALRQGMYQLQSAPLPQIMRICSSRKRWPDWQRNNVLHSKTSPRSRRMKRSTCMIYQSTIQMTYNSNIFAFKFAVKSTEKSLLWFPFRQCFLPSFPLITLRNVKAYLSCVFEKYYVKIRLQQTFSTINFHTKLLTTSLCMYTNESGIHCFA